MKITNFFGSLLFCLFSFQAFSSASGVQIFVDSNYRGASQKLNPGKYDMKDLKIGNDKLSSLKVSKGYKVTLYEHSGFKGRTWIYYGDSKYVGSTRNDKTSSIKVEKVVCLYTDPNNKGTTEGVVKGEYKTLSPSFSKNGVSSLFIPKGWTVVLFDQPNFKGNSVTYYAATDLNIPYVQKPFDDHIKSMIVGEI